MLDKYLITGGCGFIGHHLVEHLLKNTDGEIVILDKLGYSSAGFERLRDIDVYDDKRIRIFTHDFNNPLIDGIKKEIGRVDFIIHMGAETHVDKSVTEPEAFVRTNVLGTLNMLEYAKNLDSLERFVYFSTDEVFGPAPLDIRYKEWDRYNSTNPYSASKAGGEELCLAYANMYGIHMIITHTMNAFGERQFPEKFIPGTVKKVLAGEKVIIHSNKEKTRAGSRFYIHCRNISAGVLHLLHHNGLLRRDKYNIVGEMEVDNLQLAQSIAAVLQKPLNYEMVDFHSSRPGHDLRYALDGTKMAELGWTPPHGFITSLEKTIEWMIAPENARWLNYD